MTGKLFKKINLLYESCARQQALFSKLFPADLQFAATDYYLLYRIIDTFEDSDFNIEIKIASLDKIAADFTGGLAAAVKTALEKYPADFKYKNLFIAFDDILLFHQSLKIKYSEAIEKYGKIMAAGMSEYLKKFELSKQKNIPFIMNFNEFDEYCYYAAGCVGELNSELFIIAGEKTNDECAFIKNGSRLGNYLQTVNIIKDYFDDYGNAHKTYFPSSIQQLSLTDQLKKIIAHSRGSEESIKKYLNAITDNKILGYCNTLFKIAKLHLNFYESNIEKICAAKKKLKPPAYKLFLSLPLKLKYYFLKYKL